MQIVAYTRLHGPIDSYIYIFFYLDTLLSFVFLQIAYWKLTHWVSTELV